MKLTIRNRILLFQFITLAVVIVSMERLTFYISKNYLEHTLEQKHTEIVYPFVEIINNYLDARITELKVLSNADVFEKGDMDYITKYLKESLKESPYIDQLVFLDTTGRKLSRAVNDHIYEFWKRGDTKQVIFDMAKNGNQGEVFIRPVYPDHSTNEIRVDLYTLVTDDSNNKVIGVLISVINIDLIKKFIGDISKGYNEGITNYLISPDNLVIFSTDSSFQSFTKYSPTSGEENYWNSSAMLRPHGTNGECKWIVLSRMDKSEALLLPNKLRISFEWASLIFLLFIFAIIYMVSTYVTKPIKNLQEGIKRVEKGDFDTVVEASYNDELGELANSFNLLVSNLKASRSELMESEERYRMITEFSPNTHILSKDGIWEYVNEAGLKLFKVKDKSEIIGQIYKKFIKKDYWTVIEKRWSLVQNFQKNLPELDLIGIRSDGSEIHIEGLSFPVEIKGETYVNVIIRDVEKQYQLTKDLVRSEELYRTVYNISNGTIWDLDMRTDKVSYSNEIYDTFGYSQTDTNFNLDWWMNNVHPDDRQKIDSFFSAIVNGEKKWNAKYRFRTNEGDWKTVEDSAVILYDENDKPYWVIGSMVDVTFQEEAEKNQIRSLIMGSENERKRLAAELHDSLGQTLALISLNLDSIIRTNTTPPFPPYLQKIKNTYSMVNQAVAEIRTITQNLMPRSLELFGLKSVIINMMNRIQEATDIQINMEISENFGRFDSNMEINIYRIIQETATNAIRHANAQSINLRLFEENGKITFICEDNGDGFDLEKIKSERVINGLQNIENRVRMLGGNVKVTSVIQKGTTVEIQIPV